MQPGLEDGLGDRVRTDVAGFVFVSHRRFAFRPYIITTDNICSLHKYDLNSIRIDIGARIGDFCEAEETPRMICACSNAILY